MADKRKPECRIILEEGRHRVVVELFPAKLFPGGERYENHYRARVGRRWLQLSGQRYVFWSRTDILAWLACAARGVNRGGPEVTPVPAPRVESTPAPMLPKGTPVSVENGRVSPEGVRLRDRTFTLTAPFQGPDSLWRVFLVGRPEPVLVDALSR